MKKLVILRGLPSCGKSYRAKEILSENNGVGVIYSTDEYWYKIHKPELPNEYSFNPRFISDAHRWNLKRAQKSIEESCPLIIIDNTNTMASEPKPYVEYALPQNYHISIEEPTSEWWLLIRVLLQDKRFYEKELKEWAKKLEEKSKETHSVPQWAIEKMMWRWHNNLTVEDITSASGIK